MPFQKGHQKTGGKKKGTLNKKTQERREFIKSLLDNEHDNIIEALKRTRSKSPHLYLNAIITLMEFDTPKLSRTEVKHEGDIATTVEIVGTPPPDEV